MQIEITYQTRDGPTTVTIVVSPEDYFDPLEPGETFETDGVPRYNHTWQYLNVPLSCLKWSMERREGTKEDVVFRTQYMNGGRVWMNHRRDPDGYEELIHNTQTSESCVHVIRTCRSPGHPWVVTFNGEIHDNSDGSQEERRFDAPWSPEETLNYSRLSTN